MKFIKLHQSGKELLVNLSNVSEVCAANDNESRLFFNFTAGDYQVSIPADESIDEILELIKQEADMCKYTKDGKQTTP